MDPLFGVSNAESDLQDPAFAAVPAQPRSSPEDGGVVLDAAQKGDVQGLKAALAAGGSTEEADAVSAT